MDWSLPKKPFFCREWVYDKLLMYLRAAKLPYTGVVLLGGAGCGKTALLVEMMRSDLDEGSPQALCQQHLLAVHFCCRLYEPSQQVGTLVTNLRNQLLQHYVIGPLYKVVLQRVEQRNPTLFHWERLANAGHEALLFGIIEPLTSLAIAAPSGQHWMLAVDALDAAPAVYEALAAIARNLPSWLLLLVTCRREERTSGRQRLTGFSKLHLADVRRAQVLRDVQQYILCRLDTDRILRQHLNRHTASLLNQLHIKGNACFLYLECVLDYVAADVLVLSDINAIPGTLNGLYLFLCQKMLSGDTWAIMRPLFALVIAVARPVSLANVYKALRMGVPDFNLASFEAMLQQHCSLLSFSVSHKEGEASVPYVTLAHSSLSEWLQDAKHCTQNFLCSKSEGAYLLALLLTARAPDIDLIDAARLAEALTQCSADQCFTLHHILIWFIMAAASGTKYKRPDSCPLETNAMKALCAFTDVLNNWETVVDHSTLFCMEPQVAEACGTFDQQLQAQCFLGAIKDAQNCGFTSLMSSSYQGALEATRSLLLRGGLNVNGRDSRGLSALDYAVLGGHADVVAVLLSEGAMLDSGAVGQQTLRTAVYNGDAGLVALLLSTGVNLDAKDEDGCTPLFLATYKGNFDIVQLLLDTGADVSAQDCCNRTALSLACMCPNSAQDPVALAQLLVEHGSVVNHADSEGCTPLIYACYAGHRDLVEYLLEADADVDAADLAGQTALLAASYLGHAEIVQLLLFFGASIHHLDALGRSALSLAVLQDRLDVPDGLLARGLDENHRDNLGMTPLHHAATAGRSAQCRLLLDFGASACAQDLDGCTPLLLATLCSRYATASVLLDRDPTAAELCARDGQTPLLAIVSSLSTSSSTQTDFVKLLASRGLAALNLVDKEGRSPLYLLAAEGRVDLVQHLLQHGARATLTDRHGRGPLHVAAWLGHSQVCFSLCSAGVNPDVRDSEGQTALAAAAWQSHLDVCRVLIDCGADVNAVCHQGATPLCIAAQEGHMDVCCLLLEAGARADHTDRLGRSPYRVALKCEHLGICQLLLQHGASLSVSSGERASSAATSVSSSAQLTNVTPMSSREGSAESAFVVKPPPRPQRANRDFTSAVVETTSPLLPNLPQRGPSKTSAQMAEAQRRSRPRLQLIVNNGTVINADCSDTENEMEAESDIGWLPVQAQHQRSRKETSF